MQRKRQPVERLDRHAYPIRREGLLLRHRVTDAPLQREGAETLVDTGPSVIVPRIERAAGLLEPARLTRRRSSRSYPTARTVPEATAIVALGVKRCT